MKRIIHGNPMEPDSTRDITGITPEQFEIIISGLQAEYWSMSMLASNIKALQDNEEEFNALVEKLNIGTPPGMAEDAAKALKEDPFTLIAYASERMQKIESILGDINQPYIGADY